MGNPMVHLVTVSYYSGPYIARMLRSVARATNGETAITIVNNARDDAELDVVISKTNVKAAIITLDSNRGYGGAVNAANKSSQPHSEWLLVVNPDLSFDPGAIDELLRVGMSDPAIGVVGPLIYTGAREVYPSARNLPSLRNGVGHALFSRIWKGNPWTRAYLSDHEVPPRARSAGWVSGACMMVRRRAFESIGGFDEKFFMYFEDVDLCARLGRAGWRILYAPSAEVHHVGGHATEQVNRKMVRAHHTSAYIYLAARYSAWYLWPLRVALRVGLTLRGLIAHS
ncbi:glycosyltransferase family 2 protein [Parafrigoribacterium mesophilum]|uniref:glycosyltransferase family 2 protein n=1 Tax=Parafrigoribacterium mesophilum TaxID=433646 RepID=UPI0031FC8CAA